MAEIDDRTVVRRSDVQVSTELDAEVVALHTGRNTFFTMNEVASRIWQLVESPRAVADIVDVLVAEFEVDRATCTTELVTLLDELVTKELVVIVEG